MGLVLAIPHLNRRVDHEICRRIEGQFAQHFQDLKVTVRSAEVVPGRGILVRGLALAEPDALGPRAELALVEEVFLSCPTDLEKLLQGEVEVRRVLLRRPTIRATRRADGAWSVTKLLRPRTTQQKILDVKIENGVLEVFDPTKIPSTSLTLRDVQLTLKAAEDSGVQTRNYVFEGTFTGDLLRQARFSGTLDSWSRRWTLDGAAEGLEISSEWQRALPEPLRAHLEILRSLRAQGTLDFHVEHDPDARPAYRFRCTGLIARGRLDDPRLPRPLTDIRGTVECTEEGVSIERLVARSGQASVQLSGRRLGYEPHSPLTLHAEIRDLDLDRELRDSLPETVRELWYRYLPAGKIHADVAASYDGRAWHPDIAVQCVAVAFTYDKFPYRLEQGQGSVTLQDDLLSANLTAYSGNLPVRIRGEMRHPLDGPVGWVEAKGEAIRIDEKLLDAIPGKSRAVIRAMEPRGTLDFVARAWREKPDEPFHRRVLVGLNRCAIRYEKFPFSIHAIRGTLDLADNDWTFRDLEGAHGAGRITGEGSLTATPEGNRLWLRLAGSGISLEEELRDALQPGMQQVWNNLQPQGSVDLEVEIEHLSGQDRFAVSLRAEPRSENASIKPTYFPYRLENLRGLLTYRDGRVNLERFRGEHGNTRVTCKGQCDFSPDGSWRLRLEDLDVERLRVDRELAAVLPGRLKKAFSELNPAGPVHLRGTLGLSQSGRPGEPLASEWDVQIGYQRASIDVGLRLENLHGEMRLTGACDGDRFWSRGELAVDSAMYRDFQVAEMTGPVWIDDQRILFGAWVDRPQPGQERPAGELRSPRSVTGRLFGGLLSCDGWVALGPTPRYSVHAQLTGGDLKRCVQELGSPARDLSGIIRSEVQLHGSGRSLNSLGGHGKIELSNADIYELPVMIAVLKMLRARRPDRSAFSQSDIDFRIEGGHIYLDRIKFSGDAMSLVGEGEMNFQSDIRLRLHAMVGRGERDLPLLHDLLSGASQQIMQIHVGGTLQNPETRREPFPGVARALQQLQPDPDAKRPSPRRW